MGIGSDPVHGFKDIFMHDVDGKAHLTAELIHTVGQLRKRDFGRTDLHKHNHREKFLEDRLRHIDDIDVVFIADIAYPCKNPHHIFAGHCNYRSHEVPLSCSDLLQKQPGIRPILALAFKKKNDKINRVRKKTRRSVLTSFNLLFYMKPGLIANYFLPRCIGYGNKPDPYFIYRFCQEGVPMGIPEDLHMHSENSPDGIHSVTFLCEKAIEKGIGCIAITDHCEINGFYEENYNVAVKQSFFDTRKAQVVFGDQLTICSGVELGQATHDFGLAEKVTGAFPFDLVLGSIHNLPGKEDFAFLDYSREDPEQLFGLYLDEMRRLVEWGRFDVLAHLTYPLRYMEGEYGYRFSPEPFREKILRIMDIMIRKGIGLEVNTSGLRQNLGKTMPDIWYLKLYKNAGGSLLTFGSDAHSADDIGSNIREGIETAEQAGFDSYAVYRNRKPTLKKFRPLLDVT